MKKNPGALYALPLGGWLFLFFIVPLTIIFVYSFLTKGLYGGASLPATLKAYQSLFNPTFLKVLVNTLIITVFATMSMVLIGAPAAWFIARSVKKNFFLMLIIIPFWTNFLIRIYAWLAILGSEGVINQALMSWGIIDRPFQFLYNAKAVTFITVYAYLPYAILPLYSSMEKFDFSLIEAARDLGANTFQATMKVLLPSIRPGITTAVLFTFIPVLGSYAIPQIVGGASSMMLGNVIAQQLTVARNWPLASSISFVLTLITTIGVVIFMKLNQASSEQQIEKE